MVQGTGYVHAFLFSCASLLTRHTSCPLYLLSRRCALVWPTASLFSLCITFNCAAPKPINPMKTRDILSCEAHRTQRPRAAHSCYTLQCSWSENPAAAGLYVRASILDSLTTSSVLQGRHLESCETERQYLPVPQSSWVLHPWRQDGMWLTPSSHIRITLFTSVSCCIELIVHAKCSYVKLNSIHPCFKPLSLDQLLYHVMLNR